MTVAGQLKTFRHRYRAVIVLALASFVLHLLLLWPLYEKWLEWQDREPLAEPGMEFSLVMPEPEPVPEPQEEAPPEPEQPPEPEEEPKPEPPEPERHLPRHNAEEVDLAGNSLEAPEADEPVKGQKEAEPQPARATLEVAGGEQQADPARESPEEAQPEESTNPEPTRAGKAVAEQEPAESPPAPQTLAKAPDMPSPESASESAAPAEKALEIAKASPPETGSPDPEAELPPGLEALDEDRMDEVRLGDEASELMARRLKMVNRYLEAMQKQVMERWKRPKESYPFQQGQIRVRLDAQGYLEDAWVHLPSGNPLLDITALEAVRAVPRYKVPDSREVAARFYRRLIFNYRGGEPAARTAEAPPWEKN